MQTIKQNLLNNLEDINKVFDHNNLEKQSLCLNSIYYFAENNENYELCVYVDVEVKLTEEFDSYFDDQGNDYLFSYDISEIDTITISDIFVLKDGCDSDVTFIKEEITEYLNGTIKR